MMADSQDVTREIDTSRPHSARVYDYMIGGKNHFEADREAARKVLAVLPTGNIGPRENRRFLGRAVRYLAAEVGIRQFLDIGTGLPTTNNVHDVAQTVIPAARIVYVDNDPLVLAHARALLTSAKEGATAYLDADLRDTGKILAGAAETLDFSQPVAIMLIAVLHYIEDSGQAGQIVARLLDAVPPGSFLVVTHAGIDLFPEEIGPFEEVLNRHLPGDHHVARTREAVTGLFDPVRLLEPGVVRVSDWRPGSPDEAATPTTLWGGVGVKP
jgi:hypothetical protein